MGETPPVPLDILYEARPSPDPWTYPDTRIEGAFRGISVAGLLSASPCIDLYEWQDSVNGNGRLRQPVKDKVLRPKYAAISHVWGASEAVQRISRSANRSLKIYKEADHPITICWQGLVEAAQAARFCECDYLWLDLFCIDQRRTADKRMQIENMGNIYELATVVIVMIGGADAVQRIDEGSSWIDRAWTLQEAVVCPNTAVLVTWPQHWPEKFNAPPVCRDPGDDPNRFHVEFKRIQGTDLALVDMKALLHLQLTAGQIIVDINGKQEPVKLPPKFAIRCFDSSLHDSENDTLSLSAGRLALVAVLEACEKSDEGKINKEMKHCAVWRSMHLRISTNQEDIVLSILHLLDVKLDGTKDADLNELYRRLVQRVTINGIPAWLGIGGSSGDIIPRNLTSGIYPELPIRQKREDFATETELPKYHVDDHPLPVTKFISRSGDYISEFDILFKNWGSTDPYVCCTMLEFESSPIDTFTTLSADAGEYKYTRLKNPHVTGILTYKSSWVSSNRGAMGPRLQVMFIGRIQWLERFSLPAREPDHSSWYVYIVHKDHAGWVRVGSGMCVITDGELPDDRKHLVFGQRLKVRDLESDCECNNRPVRQRTGQRGTTQPRSLDCPQCGWSGSSAKRSKGPTQPAFEADGNITRDNVHALLTKAKDLNLDGLRDQVRWTIEHQPEILNLSTFEKYVLGVCHDIDELVDPNKREVIEKFEEFAAGNFEGLCEKHPNPGPVIAELCGEWKKLGDEMKSEYETKERLSDEKFRDLERKYDRTVRDYDAKIKNLSKRAPDFDFLINNLNLGDHATAIKHFEAYLVNRPENFEKPLSEMVWWDVRCKECRRIHIRQGQGIWIVRNIGPENVRGWVLCDYCSQKTGLALARGGALFRVPTYPGTFVFL